VIAFKYNYILNLELNVVLNGLKQDRSNGCRTCFMSKPIYFSCDIFFKATWLPCPSIAKKCLLMKDNPLGINFLKTKKNSLNRKKHSHPSLFLHCHVGL
jgi:hypothetical protein